MIAAAMFTWPKHHASVKLATAEILLIAASHSIPYRQQPHSSSNTHADGECVSACCLVTSLPALCQNNTLDEEVTFDELRIRGSATPFSPTATQRLPDELPSLTTHYSSVPKQRITAQSWTQRYVFSLRLSPYPQVTSTVVLPWVMHVLFCRA